MSDPVETFIARWQAAGGSERANYRLFITELCELLGLPKPEPARAEAGDNAYVFERRVTSSHGDGSSSSTRGCGQSFSVPPAAGGGRYPGDGGSGRHAIAQDADKCATPGSRSAPGPQTVGAGGTANMEALKAADGSRSGPPVPFLLSWRFQANGWPRLCRREVSVECKNRLHGR